MNNDKQPTATTPEGTDRVVGKPSFAKSSQAIEVTELGKTYVADDVVATIARLAAEQVPGVHRLGGTGLRGAVARLAKNTGVASEVGMRQAALTLELVIEFGYRLSEVAEEIRARVIEAVEHMADREVIAVDIHVVDVYVPKQEQARTRELQ